MVIVELIGSLKAYEQRLKRSNGYNLENTFPSKINLHPKKSIKKNSKI